MTTQTELQRARQIVEHNKTFILDAISHRYAELFKFLSDYDYVHHKGTEEEEQELSTAINYLLAELHITEDDARNMFEEYQMQVDDWKNACGESEDN